MANGVGVTIKINVLYRVPTQYSLAMNLLRSGNLTLLIPVINLDPLSLLNTLKLFHTYKWVGEGIL